MPVVLGVVCKIVAVPSYLWRAPGGKNWLKVWGPVRKMPWTVVCLGVLWCFSGVRARERSLINPRKCRDPLGGRSRNWKRTGNKNRGRR